MPFHEFKGAPWPQPVVGSCRHEKFRSAVLATIVVNLARKPNNKTPCIVSPGRTLLRESCGPNNVGGLGFHCTLNPSRLPLKSNSSLVAQRAPPKGLMDGLPICSKVPKRAGPIESSRSNRMKLSAVAFGNRTSRTWKLPGPSILVPQAAAAAGDSANHLPVEKLERRTSKHMTTAGILPHPGTRGLS